MQQLAAAFDAKQQHDQQFQHSVLHALGTLTAQVQRSISSCESSVQRHSSLLTTLEARVNQLDSRAASMQHSYQLVEQHQDNCAQQANMQTMSSLHQIDVLQQLDRSLVRSLFLGMISGLAPVAHCSPMSSACHECLLVWVELEWCHLIESSM